MFYRVLSCNLTLEQTILGDWLALLIVFYHTPLWLQSYQVFFFSFPAFALVPQIVNEKTEDAVNRI